MKSMLYSKLPEIKLLVDSNKSYSEIAKEIGCSLSTLRLFLIENDMYVKKGNPYKKKSILDPYKEEIKDLLDKGYSYKEIYEKYNTTDNTLRSFLKKEGLYINKTLERQKHTILDPYHEDVLDMVKNEVPYEHMAKKLNCNVKTVKRYLVKHNLYLDRSNNYYSNKVDHEDVFCMYDSGYSVNEIKNKYNVSHEFISNILINSGYELLGKNESNTRRTNRIYEELWPDIKYDLNEDVSINKIARKYHLREERLNEFIDDKGYKQEFNGDINDLVFLQNEKGLRKSYYKIINSIITYHNNTNNIPNIYQLEEVSSLTLSTIYKVLKDFPILKKYVRYQRRRSLYEDNFASFLDENNIKYKRNFRVKDEENNSYKEVDFLLTQNNLGIEINPAVTHSADFSLYAGKNSITRKYHQDKAILAQKQGIKLIHLYSHDLYDSNRRKIINNMILNSINGIKTIGARKCIIKSVSRKDSNEFLKKYHLQGSETSSCYRYGLYYNDELVSLLAIGKSRFTKDDYEIIRYCVRYDLGVTGGFPKLFKHFLSILEKNTKIISYYDFDKQFVLKNIYEKNGFVLDKITSPGYMWFSKNSKEWLSRYQTTKSKLIKQGYDPDKTEVEIMTDRGYIRVFDSGNKRYIYSHN